MSDSRRSSCSPSCGKSAAVVTARTPGCASALLVSMDLMTACACGLRSIFPHSSPVGYWSAPYLATPVTLSAPSWRMGRFPTVLNSTSDSTTFGS